MSAALKYSHDDKIIAFLKENYHLFLEGLVKSERSKPLSANGLMERMSLPSYLTQTFKELFPSLCRDILFREEKGFPWDWEIFRLKISVKGNSTAEIFSRPSKRGVGTKKGVPIQLFNPHGHESEDVIKFDYLLVFNAHDDQFGFYLYSAEWVRENYKNLGHQIQLPLGCKENCLFYIEVTSEMMKKFDEKHPKQTEEDVRIKEQMFEQDNIRKISRQINHRNGSK